MFAAEVGGNLAPGVGVPLEDGVGDGVGLYPAVGAGEELEDAGVACGVLELGAGAAVAHPGLGDAAVAVDGGACVAALCQEGGGVDDGEILADVVGAIVEGAKVEDLGAVVDAYAAVFIILWKLLYGICRLSLVQTTRSSRKLRAC